MELSVKKYPSLDSALKGICGEDIKLLRRIPVSGGDINRACRLELSNGSALFMKENYADNLNFFIRECEGLEAIRKTAAISVPEVLAYGLDGKSAFLLMECVEQGRRIADFYEDFGRRLLGMHRADCASFVVGGIFGFLNDNYIGAGYQLNTPEDSWKEFFRNRRLLPQIKRAEAYFDPGDRKKLDRLLEKLDELLEEPDKPALLHGDLWSGNYMCGADGCAWLIDPAVYVGHPEADMAMTELFGGFPLAFYEAYFGGKKPEAYEDRRDIYNLYHLLNHLNLFGGSYYGSVMRIVYHYV